MRIILAIACLVCWLGTESAGAASALKTQVEVGSRGEEVVIYFDQPVSLVKEFALKNPQRFVVDLKAIENGRGVGLSTDYTGQLLRDIRYGKPKPDISRIVLDLAQAVPPPTVTIGKSPPRLGIALRHGDSSSAAESSAPVPAAKPKQQARHAAKPLIVIDPGHGGKDSGAIGASGIMEKHVTLRYAKMMRDVLRESGRYRVKLTRTDDRYLFLKERVNVARKYNADMFISLHADSNPNRTARGFSVYTLSEEASDAETAALAAQENRADVIGGIDLAVEDKDVATILLDLAQRETRNKGSELAELIIANMDPKVPLLTNTHRFAGFRVLKAPDIPSVLVEVGFLSNREDERRLQSREYQDKVTRSLLDAIDAYWQGRKRTNTTAAVRQRGYHITLLSNQTTDIHQPAEKQAESSAFTLNPHLKYYLESGHYSKYAEGVMGIKAYQIPPDTVMSLATKPISLDQEGINYMIQIVFATQLQKELNREWDTTIKSLMLHHTEAFKAFYKGENMNDLFNTYYHDWPDGEPGTFGEKFNIYVHADEYNWAHMDNFLLRGGPDVQFEDLGPFEFVHMAPKEMVKQINEREERRQQMLAQEAQDAEKEETEGQRQAGVQADEARESGSNRQPPGQPLFGELLNVLGW